MCIRDRAYVGIFPSFLGYIFYNRGVAEVGASKASLFIHLCLLYTSDAADERSSVDLGGRRIIKKKNTKGDRWTSLHSITHTHQAQEHKKRAKKYRWKEGQSS